MNTKIKKFLIPWREDLDKKWWHRLANIVIYGSTIFVVIFILSLILTGSSWKRINYTYSFESNYNIISGEESVCKFTKSGFFDPIINCGNIANPTDFLNKYAEAIRNGNMLIELKAGSKIYNNQLLDKLIDAGKFDNIKVKSSYEIIYSRLFRNFGIGVLLIFAWFVFWESIIYRVILYVVYGKN